MLLLVGDWWGDGNCHRVFSVGSVGEGSNILVILAV